MTRIYKTMTGREVDLESILSRNETVPAVGNLNVNARGDLLGPGGKIIKSREELLQEYYDDTPGVHLEPFSAPKPQSSNNKDSTPTKQATVDTLSFNENVETASEEYVKVQSEGRKKK